MKKPLVLILKSAVGAALAANFVVYGLTAVVAFCPGVPALWRPTRYTAENCSRWKVVGDSLERKAWFRETDRIRQASKVLRTDGPYTLWDTPRGRFWITTDTDVLPAILAQHVVKYYGDREWGVRAGDVVFDCGAHVGTFTRDALSRGARLVIAIEPAPRAVECLRRNFAKEIAAGRVVVVPKGIWDTCGTLRFFLNGNSDAGDSFVVHGDNVPAVEVPVTTVDALTRELGIDRLDFIKTDIKGATERFLAGSTDVIRRFHPRMAIATEEPPEDNARIRVLVQMLAPYKMHCGHCFLAEDQIRMEALLFK